MASTVPPKCYHDDFQGRSGIEVAREADLCREGETLAEKQCDKNPGHVGFISFKDIQLEDLPEKHRTQETLDSIKRVGKRVVRLVVKKDDGTTVYGTGYVTKTYNDYLIVTNNHVVQTQTEVETCEIEFDYNSDDRSNIVYSRGVKLGTTCPTRDVSWITFNPIPDTIKQLDIVDSGMVTPIITIVYNDGRQTDIKSQVYSDKGTPTFITGGNLNHPDIFIMFVKFIDGSLSYLVSPFLTFQLIPSQAIEDVNIEIHIEKENDKKRIIPAVITKLDNNYVVKSSKSLNQCEAGKCKLVSKGNLLGHGKRLYFSNKDPKDYFSRVIGVDFQDFVEYYRDKVWIFDINPRSEKIQKHNERESRQCVIEHMLVIGHPHGSIKTVTFGRHLGINIEVFDNHGRRIENPDERCCCKRVMCMKYSCKTCPGSSGSMVCDLVDISYYPYPHFMGERLCLLYDGELIENINTAWVTYSYT